MTSLTLLSDGSLIVAWDDGVVQKWSLDDNEPGEPLWEIRLVTCNPPMVAELDGRIVVDDRLLVGNAAGRIFLLMANGAVDVAAVARPHHLLRGIIPLGGSFTDGTASFATYTVHGEVISWAQTHIGSIFEETTQIRNLNVKVYAVAHEGGQVAVMSRNCSLHLFSVPSWKRVWDLDPLYRENEREAPLAPALAFSPDGTLLAAGPWLGDHTVRLIRVATGEVLRTCVLDHFPETLQFLPAISYNLVTGVFADDDQEEFQVATWRPFQREESRIRSLSYETEVAPFLLRGVFYHLGPCIAA